MDQRPDSSVFPRTFNSGLGIEFLVDPMSFQYAPGIFGPRPEYRSLNAIRPSLRDPRCNGPDPVYAIAMDVGRCEDANELERRMLLFGIVMYAAGTLGEEPVRSQGHVHRISPHCGWSTPELFEVWEGHAVVFAQQKSGDDPGRCFAIEAGSGGRVVIPPGWAHYVANGDPNSHLIFAAWCDRQFGFDYTQMRAHGGLAWFPIIGSDGKVEWKANRNYSLSRLEQSEARAYPELGLSLDMPIYEHLRQAPESIQWISDPARFRNLWPQFEP